MKEPERAPTSLPDRCVRHPPSVQPGEPEGWRTCQKEEHTGSSEWQAHWQ